MPTIILNGKIYLSKENFCEALIMDKGRITAFGSTHDLLSIAPNNIEKIDAEGALVLPAFHDSHIHLMWAGRREGGIECTGAKSVEDLVSRGRELISRLKPKEGSYIEGSGLNPDLFTKGEKRELCREDLDRITTAHPLVISRHCGHILYCNSFALKRAGLSEAAPNLEGGTVERDNNGRPTGVFKENAANMIRKFEPDYSRKEMKEQLRIGMEKAHSLGISSCGSYDTNGSDFNRVVEAYRDLYDDFRKQDIPGLRVAMQCGISDREDMLDILLERGKAIFWDDPEWGTFLKAASLKLFADGTLGGHTAWLKQPYKDKGETCGFPVVDEASLNRFVQKASDKGMQVLIHSIGDAAIDSVLKAFEKVTAPGENPLRHGIIHCQITSPDLLERMARNKILAIVQPIFLADDIHVLEQRVGAQLASTSYAWGSMLRLGLPVSFSTDAPVSPMNPLLCIEWAVLRRDSEDPSAASFYPAEKVDIYSALDAYTKNSVYANFEEAKLGSIKEGNYADLVFLDRDIFTIPPEEIHKAKVLRTICAGKPVYNI